MVNFKLMDQLLDIFDRDRLRGSEGLAKAILRTFAKAFRLFRRLVDPGGAQGNNLPRS
jgi:hypothetical protein